MPEKKYLLKVFLSYASQDKLIVQELSTRLAGEGWIDTWVDEKKLLPGQDWRTKIEEAVETSDIVIICLSNNSVSKEGFVQKELRYAREISFEKPDETIFLVPLRLDDCTVPRGLRFYQWADYFGENKEDTYNALTESLKIRYEQKRNILEKEYARLEKEKQEHELAKKIAREKEEIEKARLMAEEKEKVEREAAEKIAREKEEIERARIKAEEEKQRIAKEKAEREAAKKARQKKLKLLFTKSKPFFRIAGIIGIVTILLLGGSLAAPSLLSLISPTATLTSTITDIPTKTFFPTTTVVTPSPISTSTIHLTQYPTITITPLLTSTSTPTSLPMDLRVDREGTYKFHFLVRNPPNCNAGYCQVNWRVWIGSWIDGKQNNGVDWNSFVGDPNKDTGWQRIPSSSITFDIDTTPYDLFAPAPRKPYLVVVKVCTDNTKSNCQQASGVVP